VKNTHSLMSAVLIGGVVFTCCSRPDPEDFVAGRKELARQEFCSAAPGVLDKPFDAQEWQRSGPENRGLMARDLICSARLIGKTRQQAIALLGRPDGEFPGHLVFRVVYPAPFEYRKYEPPPPRGRRVLPDTYDLVAEFRPSADAIWSLETRAALEPDSQAGRQPDGSAR
jgi:hypothetical protein